MKDYYKGQVNRPKYRGEEKTSIATIIKKESSYVGSKPTVRRQSLGQVDTLLTINRYQKLAKMRNKEKWREVIEEVVGTAIQKWRNDEIERHDKRAAYREQQDMKKEEVRRREINMESEGVQQMMLGETRSIIQERGARDNTEIRQLEMGIQQMTIVQIPEIAAIRNAIGGNERQQRRVQFSNERKR